MTRATLDVVGCGAVVRQFHLPSLQWLESQGYVQVRYCLDPNISAARRIAARLRRATAMPAPSPSAVDAPGASLALVATPPEFHAMWARRYLESGAGVLVEKPAVVTVEEFMALSEIARAAKGPVLVGHVRRLFPSVQAAREAVARGMIGAVRSVEAYEGFRRAWRTESDYPVRSRAGGVLYAVGPHVLDAVLFICGIDSAGETLAADITATARWPDEEPSHDLQASLRMRADGCDTALTLHLSRVEALANVIRVRGERGEILVSSDYRDHALLRTERGATRLMPEMEIPHTANLFGCFLAEHLELWRLWSGAAAESVLSLGRFAHLTRLLEALSREH